MNRIDIKRLLPVILSVSVIFLVVALHRYRMPLTQYPFINAYNYTVLFDCFSYVKSIAIILCALLAIILLVYYLVVGRRKLRRSYLYIPMALYALFILLSFFAGERYPFELMGSPERFEGLIVHLCYLIILFYAINFIDSEREIRFITDALFITVFIACIIGFTQHFGKDVITAILNGPGADTDSTAIMLEQGSGSVYQTVYNPNYVGLYMCLVIPLILDRIFESISDIKTGEDKAVRRKMYLGYLLILFVICLLNIYWSDSVGSMPGLIFGSVAVIILRSSCKNKKTPVIILALSYVLMAVLLICGIFGKNHSPLFKDATDRTEIQYIKTYDNTIEFRINDQVMITSFNNATGVFELKDETGSDLNLYMLPESDRTYQIDRSKLNGRISFTPVIFDGNTYAIFEMKDKIWRFMYTEDGVRYLNDVDKLETLDIVKHGDIIRNYAFGSGRGYIWDTMIPLLKDHLFTGAGADSFMAVFPQNDYATRYSHGLSTGSIYDKPHNMYLQIWLSFGLTGLVSFLVMTVYAMTMIIRKGYNVRNGISLVIVAGLAGFLIAAFLNDSSVQVMPMFFGLFGCAVASSVTT